MTEIIEKSGRQRMMALGIGESTDFPLTRLDAVRADCYRYGIQWGKKFSSKINKESRTVTVTRIA